MNKNAPWVEPIATAIAADRAQLLAFTRTISPEQWDAPSHVPNWANRDVLAHLAGGNDQLVQIILRAITSNEPLDASLLQPDTDAENATRIEERRRWTIPDLIAELERDSAEVHEMLVQLTDEHETLDLPGMNLRLGDFLRIVQHERHDAEHLVHINTGNR